jgi:hypothetical protein
VAERLGYACASAYTVVQFHSPDSLESKSQVSPFRAVLLVYGSATSAAILDERFLPKQVTQLRQ